LKSEESTPLLDQRFYQKKINLGTGTRSSFKFSEKKLELRPEVLLKIKDLTNIG
jgi:hypothetical protein